MSSTARSTIPVVLITTYPGADLLCEAARLGVSVFAKPFTLDRLSDAAIAPLLAPERSRAGHE